MASAGQQLVAGRVPGEEITIDQLNTDSSTFTTTPIEIASVTASLVEGRTYWVCYDAGVQSTASSDVVKFEIQEDSLGGTVIQIRHHPVADTSVSAATGRGRFTATTSGSKTFVLAGVRQSGSGTLNVNAGSSFPTFFWVEYVEG